jgi:hypothetical protein
MKINGKDYTVAADGRLVKTAIFGSVSKQRADQNAEILRRLQAIERSQSKSHGFNLGGVSGLLLGGLSAAHLTAKSLDRVKTTTRLGRLANKSQVPVGLGAGALGALLGGRLGDYLWSR